MLLLSKPKKFVRFVGDASTPSGMTKDLTPLVDQFKSMEDRLVRLLQDKSPAKPSTPPGSPSPSPTPPQPPPPALQGQSLRGPRPTQQSSVDNHNNPGQRGPRFHGPPVNNNGHNNHGGWNAGQQGQRFVNSGSGPRFRGPMPPPLLPPSPQIFPVRQNQNNCLLDPGPGLGPRANYGCYVSGQVGCHSLLHSPTEQNGQRFRPPRLASTSPVHFNQGNGPRSPTTGARAPPNSLRPPFN